MADGHLVLLEEYKLKLSGKLDVVGERGTDDDDDDGVLLVAVMTMIV